MGKIFGAPLQVHSDLKIVLTNPYGAKTGALGKWYKKNFGTNMHNGVDLILSGPRYKSYGTPLVSIMDGMVPFIVDRGELNHRGNGVFIQAHDRKWQTLHWHMSKIFVKSGDYIKKGQIIGTMGRSGTVTPAPTFTSPYNGTHLHFGLEKLLDGNYVHVDPMKYIDLGDHLVGEDTSVEYDVAPLAWVVQHAETQVRELEARIKALREQKRG